MQVGYPGAGGRKVEQQQSGTREPLGPQKGSRRLTRRLIGLTAALRRRCDSLSQGGCIRIGSDINSSVPRIQEATNQEPLARLDYTIGRDIPIAAFGMRSEEHTSELQSLMRISDAVFCLKKKYNIIYA